MVGSATNLEVESSPLAFSPSILSCYKCKINGLLYLMGLALNSWLRFSASHIRDISHEVCLFDFGKVCAIIGSTM
jgi:hypothetical protein